jgi:hypothetical protein
VTLGPRASEANAEKKAFAKKLLDEPASKKSLAELELATLKVKQAHEMDMAKLMFDQRVALRGAKTSKRAIDQPRES